MLFQGAKKSCQDVRLEITEGNEEHIHQEGGQVCTLSLCLKCTGS